MNETAHHRKYQTDKNALGVAGAPSTSFQTCTSGTPNAAPSTVAVRSLPPRPSVVIAPAATSPPALYKMLFLLSASRVHLPCPSRAIQCHNGVQDHDTPTSPCVRPLMTRQVLHACLGPAQIQLTHDHQPLRHRPTTSVNQQCDHTLLHKTCISRQQAEGKPRKGKLVNMPQPRKPIDG